jgi:hypothetical protein
LCTLFFSATILYLYDDLLALSHNKLFSKPCSQLQLRWKSKFSLYSVRTLNTGPGAATLTNVALYFKETVQEQYVREKTHFLLSKQTHVKKEDDANTKQINGGENQRDWLALKFTWSFTTLPILQDASTPRYTFTMQLTLTTHLSPMHHSTNPWFTGAAFETHIQNPPSETEAPFPWAPLSPTSFRPKLFTLALSRGNFIEPFQLSIKKSYPIFRTVPYRFCPNRYAWQLLFDTSPYPPREEWKDDFLTGGLKASLEYHQYWEKREFVRGWIDRKDKTWVERLDLGWWLSPEIGDVYRKRKSP